MVTTVWGLPLTTILLVLALILVPFILLVVLLERMSNDKTNVKPVPSRSKQSLPEPPPKPDKSMTKEEREKARKKRDRFFSDRRWSKYMQELNTQMKESDFFGMAYTYLAQAQMLRDEGRDYSRIAALIPELQKLARDKELKKIFQPGVCRSVEIRTTRDKGCCPGCRAMEGKVFTIEDALKNNGLAGYHCTNMEFEIGVPWCRCCFLPVVERSPQS